MAAYLEGTVPFVEFLAYDEQLGTLLGGIRKVETGYEYQPLHDVNGRYLLPASYEVIKSERFKTDQTWYLQANRPQECYGYHDESNMRCLDSHGHLGPALMRLSNIVWSALECYGTPPLGEVVHNELVRWSFWRIDASDESGATFPLCVTFSTETHSLATLMRAAVKQRDWAHAVLSKEMHGIARASVIELARRSKD